ncbi:MAG: biosynthetic-type acetolactate synthase large subunit [Gammaproteobacteria bacterium]
MKYTGAQIIVKLLERQGITMVAGIPGGANLPLYDALAESPIRHILTRHEQGAGFIAQGMARTTGQPAVCLASSGPGATNLVTAVADAYMDSIPLIAITGQVSTGMIGTDAFQETDTFGLMLPITKHNWLVRSVEELLEVIPEAFRLATSGRPGPVAIDVPKDIQQHTLDIDAWPEPVRPAAPTAPDADDLQRLQGMLRNAKRPVLMVGGGIIHAGCSREIVTFAERMDLPTVASFMGLGAMPADHPLFLGMLGMHGAPYTNMVLEECDLLIGAGVRFDDRATGKANEFCPQAAIVHIDIDASELGKIKTPSLAIRADVGETIRRLLLEIEPVSRPLWRQRVAALQTNHPLALPGSEDVFRPYGLLSHIAESFAGEDVNVVTDVGQHQMWTAQAFPMQRPRQWISSGGLGTMGFGLPAAIGAALAQPERPTVCISGDGSLMMNIQELDTAVEHGLNVKIVIMNNNHLGLVRQQQALFYGARFAAVNNRRGVDFAALAAAMGASGYDLGKAEDPHATLSRALREEGPCVINVPIAAEEMVLPMVPPGAANREMITEETA